MRPVNVILMCVQIPASKDRINCVGHQNHQTAEMSKLSFPVCSVPYTETGEHLPELLPCTHSVCELCVENKLFQYFDKSLSCPECQKEHHFCDGVETVSENQYIVMFIRNGQQNKCNVHNLELSLFCEETQCQIPICGLCVKDKHKGHDFDSLEKLKEKRSKMLMEEIESFRMSWTSNKDKIEALKNGNDQKSDECMEEIELSREEMLKRLNEQFDKLVAKVSEQKSEVKKILNDATEMMKAKSQIIQSVEDATEKAAGRRFVDNLQTVKNVTSEMNNLVSELDSNKFFEFRVKDIPDSTIRNICGDLIQNYFTRNTVVNPIGSPAPKRRCTQVDSVVESHNKLVKSIRKSAYSVTTTTADIGGSRGGCARCAPPHLPGILVFETYFFQFHALFT